VGLNVMSNSEHRNKAQRADRTVMDVVTKAEKTVSDAASRVERTVFGGKK